MALVGITAHLGLFRDAKLQAGETMFVNGGTGGVGSMVVQMAKAPGRRVITTAGSDEKVAPCRELGADLAINYKTDDVDARRQGVCARRASTSSGKRCASPTSTGSCRCSAQRGRMILMAGRDARPPFPVGPFYVKGCSLHGFVMFKATPDEQRGLRRGHQPLAGGRASSKPRSAASCPWRGGGGPSPAGGEHRRQAKPARWPARSS